MLQLPDAASEPEFAPAPADARDALEPSAPAVAAGLAPALQRSAVAAHTWRPSQWPQEVRALQPTAGLAKLVIMATGAQWAASCSRTGPAMAVATGLSAVSSLVSIARLACSRTDEQRARQLGIALVADSLSLGALLVVVGRTQLGTACGDDDPDEPAVFVIAAMAAALTLAQALCCAIFEPKSPPRLQASIEVLPHEAPPALAADASPAPRAAATPALPSDGGWA